MDAMRASDSDYLQPEAAVFDLVTQTYEQDEAYRQTWDRLFLAQYGITPGTPDDQVMQRAPDFARHALIQKIAEADPTQLDALRTIADEALTHMRQALPDLADMRNTVTALDAATREQWAVAAQLQMQADQRLVRTIELEGYRSAGALAATLITRLDDPTLGRQIGATNSAVFGVVSEVRTFNYALDLGASASLAALTATTGVVGAGLLLMDAFMNTGPTADDIILD
ncbi:MAG: hypothetical protein OXU67_12550, partial [Chloroflexota bacterium]|nr:hypothetical protein [Chloroflexota bacterium]